MSDLAERPAGLQFAGADQGRIPSGIMAAMAERDAVNITIDPEGGVSVDAPEDEEPEEDQPKPHYLRHDFGENLAEHMTTTQLASLAMELQEGIDADIQERRDWNETAAKTVQYLGMKIMSETGAENVGGGALSKIWDPLMLEASVHFWANSVAEFLPADGPCKVRDDAPPPVAVAQGQPQPGIGHNGGPPLVEASPQPAPAVSRNDLAQAFEKDMNHYLTKGERGYYRDFSRMLFNLGPTGTQFRKVYFCPLRGKPVSEWVRCENLIVSSDATDLTNAARITQLIKYSQAQVKRLQRSGWWRDVQLVTPEEERTETEREIGEAEGIDRQPNRQQDRLHTIQEIYTEIDLDGFWHTEDDPESEHYGEQTGMPLPYRVTMDKTSKEILEIRRNWREGDELMAARMRYVFFGMIPGLGFYAIGFMHMLGNGELTLTSLGRQLLDAGQFANFPGFLGIKGITRQISTSLNVEPGQIVEVDTMNKPISQAVMPLPYKEPSQVLAALASSLTDRLQKLAGAADIPVGEGTADVPVGTVIAMVEQATKVMAAVHKGMHASRAEELEMLRELIAEDPSVLSKGNKNPARQWEQAEEFMDLDLVPSSDPNVPSQLHRIMQATALVQISAQLPGVFDPHWVAKDTLRTIGKEVPDEAFAKPPMGPPPGPPPDPAKMKMADAAMLSAQTKAHQAAATAANAQTETQRKAAEAVTKSEADQQTAALNQQTTASTLASKEKIASMQEDTERLRLAGETAKNIHEASLAERQHASGLNQPGGGIVPQAPNGVNQ